MQSPFADSHPALLLLAHGTPDSLGEMAEYLRFVTNGRPMPAHVVEELQHRYAEIGLGDTPGAEPPPLTRWTLIQGAQVEAMFPRFAPSLAANVPRTYVGMRNWHPFIAETVAQMRRDGITSIRAVCLAPQNSRTSVGLYRRAILAAAAAQPAREATATQSALPELPAIPVEFVAGWSASPTLARAFAENLWPVWAEACAIHQRRVPVLFTAHSVPCRTIRTGAVEAPSGTAARPLAPTPEAPMGGAPAPAGGLQAYDERIAPDPYPVECKATAAAVARALAPLGMTDHDWFFAFQSQGVAGAPWIGPSVEDTLKALAQEGHTAVVFQPIGFLCDHVEILYDIDIAFRDAARALGLELFRAPSLNDSTTLTRALVEVASGQFAADIDEAAATPAPAAAEPVAASA